MDLTDILNVLKDNCRISEAAKDSESTTMIRLNELHAKKQRRIINQHNTGSVSRYTLTDILKRNPSNFGCVQCAMRVI
jgi:hypothetical protein